MKEALGWLVCLGITLSLLFTFFRPPEDDAAGLFGLVVVLVLIAAFTAVLKLGVPRAFRLFFPKRTQAALPPEA